MAVAWEKPRSRAGKLTCRDEIMLYICAYADEKDGPTPSIHEIAQEFKLAYSTVYHHVMKLIIEGRLRQQDGKLIVVGSEWYGPDDAGLSRSV